MKFAQCACFSSIVLSALFLVTGCGSVSSSNPTPTPTPTPTATPTTNATFVYVGSSGDTPNVGGSIFGFKLNQSTGALTSVAGSPFLGGNQPSAIVSDPQGRFVFVGEDNTALGTRNSNCLDNTGFVVSEQVDPATGNLTQVQSLPLAGACAFSMTVDPTGKFLYVVDLVPLNTNGQIHGFSISATGTLIELPGSPYFLGATAGDLVIHPSGKFAYTVNPNLVIMDRDLTTGILKIRSTSDTPKSNVALNPAGTFLLGSESNTSEISEFHVDANTGSVTATPTRVPILTFKTVADPLGQFFAAMVINDIATSKRVLTTLKFDSASNEYVATNNPQVSPGQTTIGLAFDPTGTFLYSVQDGADNIVGYTLDRITGSLTPIQGAPVAIPGTPVGLTTVTPQ